jgi:hypothetical protein
MSQPDDYEWLDETPFDARCYPGGLAAHDRAYLRIRARRTGIHGPRGEILLWAAWWVERIGPPYRIEVDGCSQWGDKGEAERQATWWHRHVVESYDGQHDVDLQRQGYGNVERLPDAKV